MLALCTVAGAKAAVYSGNDPFGDFKWNVDTESGVLTFTTNESVGIIFNIGDQPWKQYSEYITTIIIGENISMISEGALDGLTNVTTIVFEGTPQSYGGDSYNTLPYLLGDVFNDIDMSNATVVVPENVWDYSLESLLSNNSDIKEENIIKGEYSSGKCGDNLYWALITGSGTLTITGSGAMYDYTSGTAPWYDNRADIQTVEVGSEATTIGNYAFDGCTTLTTVTLNSNAAIGTGAVPSSAATHLILQDKQPLLMNNNTFGSVSYVRNYNNTNWQALYLPYAISYDDWSQNFDVARINNVHQYDDNSDGTPDRTTIEIFFVKSGSLSPNTPYFIRAKATGEATITVSDATLAPADAQTEWCASATDIYTFTGTYQGIPGAQMKQNNYYGMSAGSLIPVTDESNSLAAMRWYLKIASKSSAAQAARPAEVRIKEIGGTTDIPAIEPEADSTYYDLSGRPVEHPTRGIYILNNKKVFIK